MLIRIIIIYNIEWNHLYNIKINKSRFAEYIIDFNIMFNKIIFYAFSLLCFQLINAQVNFYDLKQSFQI